MKFSIGDGIDRSDELKLRKRKRLYTGVAITTALIVVAVGSYAIAKRSGENSANSPYGANITVKRDACKLFTLGDAKKLLGKNTAPSSTNANAVTATVSTSLCSYSSNDSDTTKLKVLTILVRSTNPIQAKQAFELSRAPNAETIENIGQAAYYNPDLSQLNILSNELLIRIAATEGTNGKGTIAIPKSAGKTITSRL